MQSPLSKYFGDSIEYNVFLAGCPGHHPLSPVWLPKICLWSSINTEDWLYLKHITTFPVATPPNCAQFTDLEVHYIEKYFSHFADLQAGKMKWQVSKVWVAIMKLPIIWGPGRLSQFLLDRPKNDVARQHPGQKQMQNDYQNTKWTMYWHTSIPENFNNLTTFVTAKMSTYDDFVKHFSAYVQVGHSRHSVKVQ
jgi:hypothetical protein